MQVNRDYNNLTSGFSATRNADSYLYGSEDGVDSVSNVSNQGNDISDLTDFEKGIYNEIESLFEDSHKNMLTASVKITEAAMNLMEEDSLFKDQVISALSEQVWNDQTDGITPYHAMFEITEDGVKLNTTTVSNFESSSSKEMKESYAKSQASGSFITYGMAQGTNKVNLSSFINAVNNADEETNYTDLWVQQSVIASYNNTISNSYSQALLDFSK